MKASKNIGDFREIVSTFTHVAGEALCETLWPTRCAICDRPGKVLCADCQKHLSYIDLWRTCQRCGSPLGFCQCDLCNPVSLGRLSLDTLPFDGCMSAVVFDASASAIVRSFKDLGEQRLAQIMATLMAVLISPERKPFVVTYIPDSSSAYRRRGFDHGKLLGEALAREINAPCFSLLKQPKTADQRLLGASGRIHNLAGSLTCLDTAMPQEVLLVDDVFTTGATLCAAAAALKQNGCKSVDCITFARV